MNTRTQQGCNDHQNHEVDEELADVLAAISVVTRRLARKLKMLSEQNHADPDCCNKDRQAR